MPRLLKEKCNSCKKFINIGQSITECHRCSVAIHTQCFSRSRFCKLNDNFVCQNCYPHIVIRYNPFKNLNNELDDGSDLFYSEHFTSFTGDLAEASQVLENCSNSYSSDVTKLFSNNKNTFNMLFYNIDGHRSNFDTFAAELVKFQRGLSVIGIAETNVNSDQKDLYKLDNYNSFYSNKLDGKKSGTGLAIYVDIVHTFYLLQLSNYQLSRDY